MSQREWGIKSAPKGGRPDPQSFKAVDTYTYSKIHTNSPYNPESFKAIGTYTYNKIHTNSPWVCPRYIENVHMRDGSFVIILDCKQVS